MAKRFELLVFDWDGTILDSTRAIVTSMQAACRDLGLPPPSDERARQVIGLEFGPPVATIQMPAGVDQAHRLAVGHQARQFVG